MTDGREFVSLRVQGSGLRQAINAITLKPPLNPEPPNRLNPSPPLCQGGEKEAIALCCGRARLRVFAVAGIWSPGVQGLGQRIGELNAKGLGCSEGFESRMWGCPKA